LHAVREATTKPVLGISECGLLSAMTLGHKVGVIAILRQSIPRHMRMFGAMGITQRIAAELPLGMEVVELADSARTRAGLLRVGTQLRDTHQADVVVRITGDCPLADPELLDEMIRRFKSANVDYFSNVDPPTYPDGLDIEVFTFKALEKSSQETIESFDREHVTPYLRKPGKFKTKSMQGITEFKDALESNTSPAPKSKELSRYIKGINTKRYKG
jgi:hypothetical protein